MSSAQAIAAGQGYRLPSIPQTPVQTKHPVFYPLVLSLVWAWNPHFPANINVAVGVSAFFACWALIASYFLLRNLGTGIGLALGIVAFCGLHPLFLRHAHQVMSDIPMMALMLTAAVVAERALQPRAGLRWAALAGLVTAAAVLTRTIGVTIILAVVAAGLLRRQYRPALVFLMICLPVVAAGLFWLGDNESLQPWVDQGGPGFRQTWLYYTSYLEFWKYNVPNVDVFLAMVVSNTSMLVVSVVMYFLFFSLGGSLAGALVLFPVAAAILVGIWRQARPRGWKVIHFILPCYIGVVLVWSHGEYMARFCLPLLPLFCLGIWTEVRHVFTMATATLRARGPVLEKALVTGILGGCGLLAVSVVTAYWEARGSVVENSAAQVTVEAEKKELYAWIRTQTDPSARFISSDDVDLYLHTGRQAMRPIAFSKQPSYTGNREALEQDLGNIFDTAHHIRATYWVSSDWDYFWLDDGPEIRDRVGQKLQNFPLIFQTARERIRLHRIRPARLQP